MIYFNPGTSLNVRSLRSDLEEYQIPMVGAYLNASAYIDWLNIDIDDPRKM